MTKKEPSTSHKKKKQTQNDEASLKISAQTPSKNSKKKPVDKNLLDESITQQLLGNWEYLTKLDNDELQYHPERSKLALIAASGYSQTGAISETKRLVMLAKAWGANKGAISQTLVSGVLNTLGCVASLASKEELALKLFEHSILILQPMHIKHRNNNPRIIRENIKLGLLPNAYKLMHKSMTELKKADKKSENRLEILEIELDMLRQELSLAQQRHQLYASEDNSIMASHQTIENNNKQKQLKNNSVSQLGQDLWVIKKSNYKRNGYFIEFGATNGVLLSNTYLLEKEFGWNGICAEPNPKFYMELVNNRSCKTSDACIGEKTGELVDFIFADVFGGMKKHAHEDQHLSTREVYELSGNVDELTTISLHDFLKQQKAPKKIDYLSIDTEGSEYEILRSFPFEKWDIQLLTIEHNFTSKRQDIRNLLESNGYQCEEKRWDDWYEKKPSCRN